MKVTQPIQQEGLSIGFYAWLVNLVKVINYNSMIRGPFLNDADAAVHNVSIGDPYYLSSGAVVIRLT